MIPKHLSHIFIDADDTLWENEIYFREAKHKFALLLSSYAQENTVMETFDRWQEENIPVYGYGSKTCLIGFLDTAAEICGSIPQEIYMNLKSITANILNHDLVIIDGVPETLDALSRKYSLIVATKGEQMEQKAKFHKSGLAKYFMNIEVMENKDEAHYADLAAKYSVSPENLLMVGNSVKSDIAPVVAIGGTAIYVPHDMVWEHEIMEMPMSERAIEVENFRKITDFLI